MAYWNIAATPVTVIPTGVNAPNDYIFQNTGSNTIYISDQQNVTADSTSLAIAAGTPFTWSKSDPLYAVCTANNPSTLFGTANGAQVGTSVSSLLTPTAQYVIAAATATLYRSTYTLTPGIYTVAVTPNTTIVNIDFYDVNGNLITSVTSTSGSNLTVNIATTAVQFDYWTNSGGAANASISITKSGTNIPYVSGTLYTYTSSQIIPLIGDGYAILVGAGGSSGQASGGTGSIVVIGRIKLTGSQAFISGVPGAPQLNNVNNSGITGGTSTFAGFSAPGGGGCQGTNNATPGIAGSPNGVAGTYAAAGNASSTMSTISSLPFFGLGTIGSGGGTSFLGAGTIFGIGGNGSSVGNGSPATGMGATGGGTSATGFTGGASAPGGLIIIM